MFEKTIDNWEKVWYNMGTEREKGSKKERMRKAKIGIYNHCEYRNSWDCEDGYCNCKNCGYFKLDFETLTKKQQKAIKRILSHEDDED